ncbi:flavin reductase family protein [Sulfitobacter noctilucicola]|uniref:Flavin reductase (DIM6/NTAB) family NADH-FMN oxidoreductase RutF n=1 Tax=Sulfitobacter noctilucicola TaxID=1342301 RepID=A0A7W6MAM7_9RHOB|nr:flavin reductase family protein [Sulfitobacter noctilucicola]MBB4175519.1 flavin reductase (DIM6/NTAB) family NADH-FMN oxidoreductase RutF [Sulfitobacter noctilucicola]
MAPHASMTDTLKPFAPDDGAALRSAFGRFGTGVTVITTQTPHGPLGMTANSFSSVSLDPPLVLWSPAIRSKRHDAFAEAASFCIHILGDDQRALALHFASQGHDFTGHLWEEGPQGAPQLNGCLAAFHCDTYAVHPAGDHSIIVGRITHAAERSGTGAGLLFDQGRFGAFTPKD